ncbi:hypothetical protein NE172_06905 [Clostridium botulinum]|uniref:HEPN domain-containing protein n=1 Tax=Clostridium botulinum TaxID=1491 RepID=A0A6B4JKX8_CLOBO|nr:hypothetical protein [Clostridium botulinum]EES49259.1 conserved hypothetical protein [Clostridium botulinum E1 str. 'BoNT E Beluga']MBY6760893.1 hypothetical protein [Clostridium botulinum]MBY6919815.1 hypothetical protein [Clostridium botulinum]MCR1130680.1 hypothetical protein [Clostridium botulinum]NFJ57580.1 hypothetical protein [Clostridium botulinum]
MILLDAEYTLPKEDQSFFDIEYSDFQINIKWSKNNTKDYWQLADNYFNCAYEICKEVVESGHDNVKSDMWFLPSIYMFRQSIELAIKALICRIFTLKSQVQGIFLDCKHNLYKLYEVYIQSEENYLNKSELKWIKDYLYDLEIVDKNSDLFRFPFNDDFLTNYKDKFLDIEYIGNNLLQCYSLIRMCLDKGNDSDIIEFDKDRIPQFLQLARHGIGNCYLWDSIFSDGFHKQVVGYSEAAEFLFCKCDNITNKEKAYPLLFLLRNLLELGLKRMFYKTIEHGVPKKTFDNKRKSHLLYKELWKNVRPMIEYYSNGRGDNFSIINTVEEKLKEISTIDKNGDMFRYPTSYSMEYKFNDKNIDLKNIFQYMQSIFNFLDGCDYEFSEVEEYEAECRAEMYQYEDLW